ncbi:MAG: PfkB protein [Actinomycetota bacterium]|nr:PfkB protein [Actinomycetota bacterium]
MTYDVVVVGAAGVDTLVYVPDDVPDMTRDSTMVRTVDTVGQAGGFTSRGFARLGWRTGFIGAFGDDWAAAMVRGAFAIDGVVIAAEVLDPAGTARSVNLMTPDGRRRAFYDGRGHMQVPVPQGAADALTGARVVLFHLSDWSRQLLPAARASGALVATDLQDVADVRDPYRADFIAGSDVVFMSGAHLADPAAAAARVKELGPDVVVVGLGAHGAMVRVGKGLVRQPPPSLELPVIDTNGAGDGLAVGFLHTLALIGGSSAYGEAEVADALLAGQCAARWTCARSGGDGLLTRTQLADLLVLARERAQT